MSTERKAWLNPDGSPKSVVELKEISKNWSHKVWREYAQSIEVNQTESILDKGCYIEQFTNEDNAFFSKQVSGGEKNLRLKQIMLEEVKNLSSKERHLIHLLFKQGLSLSQTGKQLGICKSTVMRNRNRLLEKLRVRTLERTYALDIGKFLREIVA